MKPYTDWTPEEVAALFLKHGVKPAVGAYYDIDGGVEYACAFGVLAMETGLPKSEIQRGTANPDYGPSALDYPRRWRLGIIEGFDGDERRSELLFDDGYHAGFALGRRVAELVGLTEATS